MIELEKVIKAIEICYSEKHNCTECELFYVEDCNDKLMRDVLELLKKQEARELSMDEWREWKANPNRNPICELWENDTSPIWVLYPNNVSELALLMGKLKLFTGKPSLEQCKAVKWNE